MPSKPHKSTPDFCVICDDLRTENNGKHLLIGVYTNVILVPALPLAMGLVFFCKIDTVPGGRTVSAAVFGPDGKVVVSLGGVQAIATPQSEPAFGAFRLPVPFRVPGNYQFRIVSASGKKVYFEHPFVVRLAGTKN
jgi:hypothetical protein